MKYSVTGKVKINYICKMSYIKSSDTVSAKIVSSLLDIKAIKIQPSSPFTWTSGWKSPIYCDNRVSLSFPDVRKYITQQLVHVIEQHFSDTEAIAGVATAGIPQAALIAQQMNLPMIYVRDKAKSHGMTNQIEGYIEENKKVVVIEDLVSTGGSSLKAVEALREAGIEVLGLCAIFTYGFDLASQSFADHKVPFASLSDYHDLINLLKSEGHISEKEYQRLSEWRKAPQEWQ